MLLSGDKDGEGGDHLKNVQMVVTSAVKTSSIPPGGNDAVKTKWDKIAWTIIL